MVRNINNKQMIVFRVYHSRLFSCLNSQKNALIFKAIRGYWSASGQRAALATAIIREIINSQPPTNLKQLSLKEKIQNINTFANFQINPEIKNQFFQFFTKGIPLNPKVFSQYSIEIGEQPKKQNDQLSRFIFCPNHLTTKQIFKILTKTKTDKSIQRQDILLTGACGVAKTISIIFFIHLAQYIHKFYFQAQENQQKKIQLSQLTKLNLIDNVPKYWYWSIDKGNDKKQSFQIQDLIYQQTTELCNQKRKILESKRKNKDQFLRYVNQFYPSSEFNKKLIVDQINQLVKEAAQWNFNYHTNFFKQEQRYVSKLPKQIFQKIKEKLLRFSQFGDQFLFNSVVYIQKNILKQSNGQLLGLGIKDRQMPNQLSFQFQKLLKDQKWAKIDFWQFFWFQIERNLVECSFPIRVIGQIKKAFFQKCTQNEFEVKSYFRFVHIPLFLNEKMNQISKQSTKNTIMEIVTSLPKQFYQFCLKQIQQKLKSFLNEGKYDKNVLIFRQLYQLALIQCDKNNINMEIQLSQFPDLLPALAIQSANLERYSRDFDKQLFSYEYNKDKSKATLLLGSYQIIQILTNQLYPNSIKYYNFEGNFRKNCKIYGSYQGVNLKSNLFQCLKPGTEIKLSLVNKQNQKDVELIFDLPFTLHYLSKDENFIPLNQKYTQKNKIQQNFKQLLQNCKQNPGYNFVALPLKQTNKFQNYPLIDFVIARFTQTKKDLVDKATDSYQFYTFEINTLDDIKKIKTKSMKTAELFKQMLKKQKSLPIKITHIVFCSSIQISKEMTKEELSTKSSRFSIHYSTWQSIKFINYFRNNLSYKNIQDFKQTVQVTKQKLKN